MTPESPQRPMAVIEHSTQNLHKQSRRPVGLPPADSQTSSLGCLRNKVPGNETNQLYSTCARWRLHADDQRLEGPQRSLPLPPLALSHEAMLQCLTLIHLCTADKYPNQNTENPVPFTEHLVSVISTEKNTPRNPMARKRTHSQWSVCICFD